MPAQPAQEGIRTVLTFMIIEKKLKSLTKVLRPLFSTAQTVIEEAGPGRQLT